MGADRVSETKAYIATACPKRSKQQAVLEQHILLYMTMPGTKMPSTSQHKRSELCIARNDDYACD